MQPVRTRQEELVEDPWQMLVVCQMLNQTSWKQVDACRPLFFDRWPTADKLVKAELAAVIETIRPLGFYNRRAKSLKAFSEAWLVALDEWPEPKLIPIKILEKMPGLGKYALDSWKIFQLNDLSVDATDKVLVQYLEYHRTLNGTISNSPS
jgi:adenine-specific DNA glycosylase